MRQLFAAAIFVGLMVMPIFSQEKPKPEDTPEKKVAALAKKYELAQQEFIKAFRAASTVEERKTAAETKAPKPDKYAAEFLQIAKQYPKSDAALDALSWVIDNLGNNNSSDDIATTVKSAVAMLATDHVKNPKIGEVCSGLGEMGTAEAVALLERIAADNNAKSVQASAVYALAEYQLSQADLARRVLGGEARDGLERDYGKDRVMRAEKSGPEAAEKQAEMYFATVVEKYADEKRMGTVTFGDSAKSELNELRNLSVGKVAPEIALKNLDEKPVKLSELKGKVVVLDIWATWCGPCKAMIPHERELVKRLESKPFAFVSISFDDTPDLVKAFIKQEAMPWTHWYHGADGPMSKAWNIKYFPTIYILDAKGVIRYKGVRGDAMDKAVETLLAEAEKK